MIIQSSPNRPNRYETKDKDVNELYHLDYAKWALSNSWNYQHERWLKSIKINKSFFKGDQWCMDEDLEAFLNDKTGQARNRIKMKYNLIRPMVQQFMGNSNILKINATAQNISPLSINRKQKMLQEKVFKTEVANEFPSAGNLMRKFDKTIGEDVAETSLIFENLYTDEYISKMNALLRFVGKMNDFDSKKVKMAQQLTTTGLVAEHAFEHGGHLRFESIESEDFFFDRNARLFDLTDADYMGFVKPLDPSYIAEKWDLEGYKLEAIESFVTQSQNAEIYQDETNTRSFTLNRVPVYTVYWKDFEAYTFGYVLNEFGEPSLVRLNDKGKDKVYTDEDLIDPISNPKNNRVFKGKKKAKMYLDVIRKCEFIPSTFFSSNNIKTRSNENISDITLSYGMVDYHETDLMDFSNCKFPIKVQTWGFVDGDVFSPVDDAIDPQRFINRVLSVTEQLINSAGGSNVIIDEDSIDANSKDDIYYDIKEGNPITVRTKGKGVPNTVGYYDATPKQGTYAMFNILPQIKNMIQDVTGVNEALKGESTGSDQLVGVTQMLMQKGSLMQEPFYEAISRLFLQMYRYTASAGKQMYIDQEVELINIIGDDGVEIFKLSKDMYNEDFNVFVERENDDNMLKSQANQMLSIFLQTGLIDNVVFANLYNRATPNDVSRALRDRVKLQQEQQRIQAGEQKRAIEQEAIASQEMMARAEIEQGLRDQENIDLERRRQDIDLDKALLSNISKENI
jgi:hypothetical protein